MKFRPTALVLALLALAPFRLGCTSPALAQTNVVFETGFESGLPAAFSAPGSTIEPVQGYAGLGPPGRTFGGNLLRYALQGIVDTKLTLRDLPQHDHVDVAFLLAVIDSWDGTELFEVSIDGAEVFSHWFQLATGDASSYVAPPGALLSSGTNLGWTFGSYHFRDRAYDLAVEPAFRGIAHTADTLEVKWSLGAISGGAASQWQGGGDESWGLDQVRVTTSLGVVGVEPGPASGLALAVAGAHPVRGGILRLRCVVPDAGPADLDWFDARGRRLARTRVSPAGASGQPIEVGLEAVAPRSPGVGFVRLRQGTAERSRRVVLLD